MKNHDDSFWWKADIGRMSQRDRNLSKPDISILRILHESSADAVASHPEASLAVDAVLMSVNTVICAVNVKLLRLERGQ